MVVFNGYSFIHLYIFALIYFKTGLGSETHTPAVMVLYSVRLLKPGFVTAQTELMMMEGANFGFIGRGDARN